MGMDPHGYPGHSLNKRDLISTLHPVPMLTNTPDLHSLFLFLFCFFFTDGLLPDQTCSHGTGEHGRSQVPGEKQHFPVTEAIFVHTKRVFDPSLENRNI